MKLRLAILGAALLAASTALHAQAPTKKGDSGKWKDRVEEVWAKARQACAATKGPERANCVAKHVCASAKNPAACEARHKARAAQQAQQQGKK